MAITKLGPVKSWGAEYGDAILGGLQQGIRGYANAKVQQLIEQQQQQQEAQKEEQQQQQQKLLEQYGLPPEAAALWDLIPQSNKLEFLLRAAQAQPEVQGESPMPSQFSEQQQLPSLLNILQGQEQPVLKNMAQFNPQDAIMRAIGNTPLRLPQQQNMNPLMNMLANQQNQEPQQQLPLQPRRSVAQQIAAAPYETPQMKLQRELAERKSTEADIRHAQKLHYPELKDIRNQGKNASETIKDIKMLRSLNDSGQLIQGVPRAILEKLGAEDLVTNAPTQIAAKLIERISVQAMQNIPSGGRATDAWRGAVQRSFGRLVNNQEALSELLDIAEDAAKQAQARSKAEAELLNQYSKSKKPLPDDIIDRIDKRAAPQIESIAQKGLDRLEKKSVQSLPSAKSVPKGTIYDNHETKKSVKSTGTGWKSIPYRGK